MGKKNERATGEDYTALVPPKLRKGGHKLVVAPQDGETTQKQTPNIPTHTQKQWGQKINPTL